MAFKQLVEKVFLHIEEILFNDELGLQVQVSFDEVVLAVHEAVNVSHHKVNWVKKVLNVEQHESKPQIDEKDDDEHLEDGFGENGFFL